VVQLLSVSLMMKWESQKNVLHLFWQSLIEIKTSPRELLFYIKPEHITVWEMQNWKTIFFMLIFA
jgi:hypothetical protein